MPRLQSAQPPRRRADPGDRITPEYRAEARRLLERWRQRYGEWCPGLDEIGHEAHPCSGEGGDRLTADHVIPVALNGTWRDGLRVLCQSANTRRGRELRGMEP